MFKIIKTINSMIECLAYNEKVSGSSPLFFINKFTNKNVSTGIIRYSLLKSILPFNLPRVNKNYRIDFIDSHVINYLVSEIILFVTLAFSIK